MVGFMLVGINLSLLIMMILFVIGTTKGTAKSLSDLALRISPKGDSVIFHEPLDQHAADVRVGGGRVPRLVPPLPEPRVAPRAGSVRDDQEHALPDGADDA